MDQSKAIARQKALYKKFNEEHFDIPENPGIYKWERIDKNKIHRVYVGQASNLKQRRFQYWLVENKLDYPKEGRFQPSLAAHAKDPDHWKFSIILQCSVEKLDENEQYWIRHYDYEPYTLSYNTTYTENKVVQSNINRLTKLLNRYRNKIKNYLDHLDITINNDNIIIKTKKLKNGNNAKISETAFNNLIDEFKKEKE